MTRRLHQIVVVGLVLLSSGVVLLWASSYASPYSNRASAHFISNLAEGDSGWMYVVESTGGWLSAVCCRGHLTVEHLLALDDDIETADIPQLNAFIIPRGAPTSLLIRQRPRFSPGGGTDARVLERRIASPLWIPLLLFAAYPLWVFLCYASRHPRVRPHLMPESLHASLLRLRRGRVWRRTTAGVSFSSISLVIALIVTANLMYSRISFERWRDLALTADWASFGLRATRTDWSMAVQPNERTERPIGPLKYSKRVRNFDLSLPSLNTVQTTRTLDFPRWLVLSTLGLYPLMLFMRERFRRRRRRRKGWCIECAYDLQGSESAICPECGEPV